MNNTVSNMQTMQQLFQIAVAALDHDLEGKINLTNGSFTMSLTVTPGFVNEINLGNGTRVRTWLFVWAGSGQTNTQLRQWMFDTLQLWDALDHDI